MAAIRPISSSFSQSVLPLLLLVFLASATAARKAPPPASSGESPKAQLGGWSPIVDLANPVVQDVARFAVSEHNREVGWSLSLIHLLSGETQVVSGTNYRLMIQASDGHVYQAVVWDQPWQKLRKLTSFTRKK